MQSSISFTTTFFLFHQTNINPLFWSNTLIVQLPLNVLAICASFVTWLWELSSNDSVFLSWISFYFWCYSFLLTILIFTGVQLRQFSYKFKRNTPKQRSCILQVIFLQIDDPVIPQHTKNILLSTSMLHKPMSHTQTQNSRDSPISLSETFSQLLVYTSIVENFLGDPGPTKTDVYSSLDINKIYPAFWGLSCANPLCPVWGCPPSHVRRKRTPVFGNHITSGNPILQLRKSN